MQENTDQKKLRIWTLFTQCEVGRFRNEIIRDSKDSFDLLLRLRPGRIKEIELVYSTLRPSTELDTPNLWTSPIVGNSKNV